MLENCQKILVIGCSGSGKSTLTRLIVEKYNLPAVHLDVHYWNPNWVETPTEEMREKIGGLCLAPSWVMDGNFSSSFDIRFPAADKIVILDLPRTTCVYRAIKRVLTYSEKIGRPDMAEGCNEKLDLEFYRYIWNFKKTDLPKIHRAIEEFNCEKKTIWLRTSKDLNKFSNSL